MRQTHHLAVGFIGIEDAGAHASDIFRERHHQIFTDGVDGGVRHLGKLLAEIVEEHLGPRGEYGQRCIVAHGCRRLLTARGHRYDGRADVLLSIAEKQFFLQQVADAVLHVAAALQFFQLDAVRGKPLMIGML